MTVLLVALGGGVGAVLRHLVGTALLGGAPVGAFPWGTLVVNVVGCFAMGALAAAAERQGYLTAEARAFLTVGLLGGFTTFSAFANETVNAARAGAALIGALNVLASVALCLAAVWSGRVAAGWWMR